MTERKHYTPEEITSLLRRADELIAGGMKIGQAIKEIDVADMTYYRWRKEAKKAATKVKHYDRPTADLNVKRLEAENAKLRRLVADLYIDKYLRGAAA